jgi:hypothetical protein
MEEEAFKAVTLSILKIPINAYGLKGADLDTYLAPHADRDINIKGFGLKLHFAQKVRFLHGVFFNVNTLRGTLLFTDLTGNASQARFPIVSIVDKKGKITGILLGGDLLLGIFHRCETLWIVETSCEVFRRFHHAFENTFTNHDLKED